MDVRISHRFNCMVPSVNKQFYISRSKPIDPLFAHMSVYVAVSLVVDFLVDRSHLQCRKRSGRAWSWKASIIVFPLCIIFSGHPQLRTLRGGYLLPERNGGGIDASVVSGKWTCAV